MRNYVDPRSVTFKPVTRATLSRGDSSLHRARSRGAPIKGKVNVRRPPLTPTSRKRKAVEERQFVSPQSDSSATCSRARHSPEADARATLTMRPKGHGGEE
ncbi:hypothetical protein MTO96_014579 [Rhipicephalus appendiculatus]